MSRLNSARRGALEEAGPAAALAGAFLLLYLRTLCPSVYLGDSGEIAAAIATGGITHPPGYPLFSLLGRAAVRLLPVGEPAFRIGCVVAAAAAGAVAVLYLLARESGCSRWAAGVGAAAYGASHTFWSQSTRVEVYSVHVCLAAVMLLAVLKYRRTGTLGWLALAAGAGSLALAHHLTIVLLGPAVLIVAGRRLWTDPGPARRAALVVSLLALGPACYLLLLYWARREPLQSWGHPVTAGLLLNHATARIYHGNLRVPGPTQLIRNLRLAAGLTDDNFPYLLCLLPVAGAVALWKRQRHSAAGLILVVVVACAYNICYRIYDIAAYYLTAWLICALLLAIGLDALRERAGDLGRRPALLTAAALVVVGVPLVRNWPSCDLSRATWVREFARNKLESVDPGGVLITEADQDTFPLWYAQEVLRIRPDVLCIDRDVLCQSWSLKKRDPSLWYFRRLRLEGVPLPDLVSPDPAARRALGTDTFLVSLLQGPLRGRPLCLTFSRGQGRKASPGEPDSGPLFDWAQRRFFLQAQGLVLRLQPQDQPVTAAALLERNQRIWRRMVLPTPGGVGTDQDLSPDYVLEYYASSLCNFGTLYQMTGDLQHAEALFRGAAELSPGSSRPREALAALEKAQRSKKSALEPLKIPLPDGTIQPAS